MRSRDEIARDSSAEALHDGRVLAIRLVPAVSRRHAVKLEIDIQDVWGSPGRITFTRTVNVRISIDFDVLRDNSTWMIERLTASIDDAAIRALVESQSRDLNVEYLDVNEVRYELPDRQSKLTDPSGLVLFQLRLNGGTLDVVARDFKISRTRGSGI